MSCSMQITESKIATCYQGKGIPGLYKFDQTEFIPKNALGGSRIPMERHGYIYFPPRCWFYNINCLVILDKLF